MSDGYSRTGQQSRNASGTIFAVNSTLPLARQLYRNRAARRIANPTFKLFRAKIAKLRVGPLARDPPLPGQCHSIAQTR